MMLVALSVCWAVFIGVWALGALYNACYAPATIRRDSSIAVQPWQGWIVAAAAVVLLQAFVPSTLWTAITFKCRRSINSPRPRLKCSGNSPT